MSGPEVRRAPDFSFLGYVFVLAVVVVFLFTSGGNNVPQLSFSELLGVIISAVFLIAAIAYLRKKRKTRYTIRDAKKAP